MRITKLHPTQNPILRFGAAFSPACSAFAFPALADAGHLSALDLRPEAPSVELLQTLSNRLPALLDST